MELPVELNKKIIEFLTSLPNVHDKKGRTALIMGVALDKKLETQIDYEGKPVDFFQLLIRTLTSYGELEKDGRDALEAVLETTKQYIGQDRREHCDTLIQEWRKCRQETTTSESANAKQPFVSADYKHDIFVSYAKADEEWSTTLVSGLKRRLAKLLGGDQIFSLWKSDEKLFRPQPMADEIVAKTIEQTATLVIVLSHEYLKSKTCNSERNAFLKNIRQQENPYSFVFLVELEKIEDNQRPQEFKKFNNHCWFWVEDEKNGLTRTLGKPTPDPDDPRDEEYYNQLNDLSRNLEKELKRLKSEAEKPETKEEKPGTCPAIFLAEVSDDLITKRNEVKRYLEQAGFRVVPDILDFCEPEAFQQEVDKILRDCKIFVQLLSDLPGRKHLEWSSYIALQYKCALKAHKPILQWRSPLLNLDDIPDEEHWNLLDGSIAVSLEEFKEKVVERAKFEADVKPAQQGAFVFINAHSKDYSLAEEVRGVMKKNSVGWALPGKQTDVFKELEQYVLYCDGVIIVYGNANVHWARTQVIRCNNMMYRRDDPLTTCLALCEGPPEKKDPLNVGFPWVKTINCQKGIREEEFKSFLKDLRAGGKS